MIGDVVTVQRRPRGLDPRDHHRGARQRPRRGGRRRARRARRRARCCVFQDRALIAPRGREADRRADAPGRAPSRTCATSTRPASRASALAIAAEPGARRAVHDDRAQRRRSAPTARACSAWANIGPVASMPVMEGKAIFYRQCAGISAMPILIDTEDVDEFVETVVRIAPTFGGIHLEDISAPACFEIERRLIERLPQPVMHDDVHGTAVVIAGRGDRRLPPRRADAARRQTVGQIGLGAAGLGIASLMRGRAASARVIASDPNPASHERARGAGASRSSTWRPSCARRDVVVATTGRARADQPGDGPPGPGHPRALQPDARDRARGRRCAAGAAFAADGTVGQQRARLPGDLPRRAGWRGARRSRWR